MNFLQKLFSGGAKVLKDETSDALFIYSRCERCQEKFRNRIDKNYDLLQNYTDTGPAYTAHKEIIGGYCRNKVIIDLEFDGNRRLTEKSIQNGRFITREEYEANRHYRE
jgi:hypothetical protein